VIRGHFCVAYFVAKDPTADRKKGKRKNATRVAAAVKKLPAAICHILHIKIIVFTLFNAIECGEERPNTLGQL